MEKSNWKILLCCSILLLCDTACGKKDKDKGKPTPTEQEEVTPVGQEQPTPLGSSSDSSDSSGSDRNPISQRLPKPDILLGVSSEKSWLFSPTTSKVFEPLLLNPSQHSSIKYVKLVVMKKRGVAAGQELYDASHLFRFYLYDQNNNIIKLKQQVGSSYLAKRTKFMLSVATNNVYLRFVAQQVESDNFHLRPMKSIIKGFQEKSGISLQSMSRESAQKLFLGRVERGTGFKVYIDNKPCVLLRRPS